MLSTFSEQRHAAPRQRGHEHARQFAHRAQVLGHELCDGWGAQHANRRAFVVGDLGVQPDGFQFVGPIDHERIRLIGYVAIDW